MPAGNIEKDHHLRISTNRGEIAATRFSPSDDQGAHPAVLIATPYRKDDWITFGSWRPSIAYLVHRGFEVVVADVPGTGASTGEPKPFSRADGRSLTTVVSELASRDWTTGSIGMFGLSYGAWTQYATAAQGPEALGAIVPVAVSPDGYKSSYTGGLFDPFKRAVWATEFHARQLLPPTDRGTDHWGSVWDARLERRANRQPWLFKFLKHTDRDAFWAERRVSADEVRVPVLAACGTRDVHTASMLPFVDSVDAETRMIVGPWRHRMPHRGREIAVGFRRIAADWFDNYLRDGVSQTPERIGKLPEIVCWTEYDGGWTSAGGWQTLREWPTADSADTMAFVVTGDGLRQGAIETWETVVTTQPVDGTVGMESMQRVGRATNCGVDTNADDARSITVETDQLEKPVEMTGTAAAELRVMSNGPETLLAARVVDVGPDGRATLVTSGRTRTSKPTDRTDIANETKEMTEIPPLVQLPLTPVSHVFETGHKIRVAVAAAHFPRAMPPDSGEALTLYSAPAAKSRLLFPGTVHEDRPAYGPVPGLGRPADDVPTGRQYVENQESKWTVTRDHTAQAGVFETAGAKTVTPPDGGLLDWERSVTARASAQNPRKAEVSTKVTGSLEHAVGTVKAEATSTVTRTQATLSSEMRVDGSVRFNEDWEVELNQEMD